jgi:hypothetical protein
VKSRLYALAFGLLALMLSAHAVRAQDVAYSFAVPVGYPSGDGWDLNGGWAFAQWTGAVYHPGEDLNYLHGSDCGMTVRSAADGLVTASGNYGTGWGNIILVRSQLPDGSFRWLQYAHLEQRYVGHGRVVHKGDIIGTVGGANGQYSCHLHFEIRKTDLSASFWPTGKSKAWVQANYENPRAFIAAHKTQPAPEIPSYVHTLFASARTTYASVLGSAKSGVNGQVHWYHNLNNPGQNDCIIQEFYGPGGAGAALVYDLAGDGDRVYLLHSGFLAKWAANGGPRSGWAMPISDEYVQSVLSNGRKTSRQEFQKGYMYYDGYTVTNDSTYPYAAPGWYQNGWQGRRSYAFSACYMRNGARNNVGEVVPNGASPAWVHDWNGLQVQDFDWGGFGRAMMVYNANHRRAYLVRTGFFGWYAANSGPVKLGAPLDEERDHSGLQHFERGRLTWSNGKVVATLYSQHLAQAQDASAVYTNDIMLIRHDIGRIYVGGSDGSRFIANSIVVDGSPTASAASDLTYHIGDVNGDGIDDVVVYYVRSGDLITMIGTENGFVRNNEFTLPVLYPNTNPGAPQFTVSVGDITGDGLADVVVHDRDIGEWLLHRSLGDEFGADEILLTGYAIGRTVPWIPFVRDVNGDGLADLVVYKDLVDQYGGGNNWLVALSTGSALKPNSSFSKRWGTSSTTVRRKPFVADLDGDGRSDIGVYDLPNGNWYVARSIGSGFAVDPYPWREGWGATTDLMRYQVITHDINGDGKDDIVLYHYAGGNWYVAISQEAHFTVATWLTNWGKTSNATLFTPLIGRFVQGM